jgi:hypothetical protein
LTKEITMSQSHFTLSFSLKSPTDAKAVAQELPPLMPDLFRAEDTIGTVHYSRFTVLSDRTLLFLGDFDGDFGPLMRDLARRAGPVFDLLQACERSAANAGREQRGCIHGMGGRASAQSRLCLQRLSGPDGQGDQGDGVRRRR